MSILSQILEALHEAEERLGRAIEAKKAPEIIKVFEGSVKCFQETYMEVAKKLSRESDCRVWPPKDGWDASAEANQDLSSGGFNFDFGFSHQANNFKATLQ